MKKTNLVWRLQNKLTLEDVEKMLSLKIITSEEAKELTFNTADDNEKVKALEEQVKFLKELVERLSIRPRDAWVYANTYTPYYSTWTAGTVLCSSTMNSIKSLSSQSVTSGNTIASTAKITG